MEFLGLEGKNINDLTRTDINKAFRKMSLKWHPDKNPGKVAESTKKFLELTAHHKFLLTQIKK